MKRITTKPWFGKKYFGWGLRPVSWEGWLVTAVFLITMISDVTYLHRNPISIVIAIVAIIVFIAVVFLTGDKPGSILWEKPKNRPWLIVAYIILAFLIFGIYQMEVLKVAHSSFEHYYKFRGCVELIEKTDTYGTCKLSSGQIIKLVKYQNKWYLDGDLPHPGLNFL